MPDEIKDKEETIAPAEKEKMRRAVLRAIGEGGEGETATVVDVPVEVAPPVVLDTPQPEKAVVEESIPAKPIFEEKPVEIVKTEPAPLTAWPPKEIKKPIAETPPPKVKLVAQVPKKVGRKKVINEQPKAPMVAAPSLPVKATLSGWTSSRIFSGLWAFLATIFAIGTIFSIVATYYPSLGSGRTDLAAFVPVPFGFVGGHPLWVNVFNEDVAALEHFYSQQENQAAAPNSETVKQIVRDAMVRRAAVNQLAREHNIWVSEKDVDAYLEKIVSEGSSLEDIERIVMNVWGWDMQQYRRKVLRPYLVKQQLFEALKADPVIGRELGSGVEASSLDHYLDTIAAAKFLTFFDIAAAR